MCNRRDVKLEKMNKEKEEVQEQEHEAIIINNGKHWWVVKRIGNEYYNLDSLLLTGPKKINKDQLRDYLN